MNVTQKSRYGALKKAAVLACVAWASMAMGIQVFAAAPFSFVAIGDTRTEPYLTGGMEQAQAMENVLKERYHNKPVRLFFDPTGIELVRAEIQERSAILTLFYRHGWPRTIVKIANGKKRVLLRDGGRQAFDLTAKPSPETELYWKGQNRVEEYNYLRVTVDGSNLKGKIHRFRPADTMKPFSVEDYLECLSDQINLLKTSNILIMQGGVQRLRAFFLIVKKRF